MKLGIQLFLLVCIAPLPAFSWQAAAVEREEYERHIKQLEERVTLLEDTVKTLLALQQSKESPPLTTSVPAATFLAPAAKKPKMPVELLPEVGQIGAQVGIILNGSANPFHLNAGQDVAGFIDLPLFDRPSWLHGKVSYEISIGLTRSKTSFTTTSNVAQVANLAVLNALSPNTGAQNIVDAVTGTGTAPFPVTARTTTTMKMLQVVPFSFKYTTNVLDRYRLRPYALLGFGTYVTIHEQSPANTGVRTDANLSPGVLSLVNQFFGGQAPFGGPLVAGQISQSPELEARGLPSGHGNFDLGVVAGGGLEVRLRNRFSLGFDSRWNRVAGTPGSLRTFGARLGFHF